MSKHDHQSESPAESMTELRDDYPTGWRVLIQNESVGYILDALLDELPGAEFTKSELAERAGVSRQSVYTHLELLVTLEVLEPVEESSPQRYRVDRESAVLQTLTELDGAVNAALADA